MIPPAEERALSRSFEPLEPTPAQVARMRAAVEARLVAPPPSLAREWLAVLGARPLVNGAWAAAALAALLLTSPLAAVPAALAAGLEAGAARRPPTAGQVAPSPGPPTRRGFGLAPGTAYPAPSSRAVSQAERSRRLSSDPPWPRPG